MCDVAAGNDEVAVAFCDSAVSSAKVMGRTFNEELLSCAFFNTKAETWRWFCLQANSNVPSGKQKYSN